MTDDIVTRLRKKFGGQLPICAEAADEIERLTREYELMDNQTMKDYIEDLLQERAEMYERINRLETQNTYLAAETARLERELGKHV